MSILSQDKCCASKHIRFANKKFNNKNHIRSRNRSNLFCGITEQASYSKNTNQNKKRIALSPANYEFRYRAQAELVVGETKNQRKIQFACFSLQFYKCNHKDKATLTQKCNFKFCFLSRV